MALVVWVAEEAVEEIPALARLAQKPEELKAKAEELRLRLEKNGVAVKKYPESAYAGMVDVMCSTRPAMASDSAMVGEMDDSMGEYLKALRKIRK